jgi:superfamily II DNA or RNA helicase
MSQISFIDAEAANTIKLYDFQERAIEELRRNILAGVKNQVLCSPTGSGKTIIATFLLREAHNRGKRAIFLADRIALIDQTSAVLDRYGIPHGVIQGQHWRQRPWERIQVASPQTIERRDWPEDLDLIIVDECHTQRKVTLDRIADRDCYTIGLTATPFSSGMGKFFEAVVSVTTTNELISSQRLAPYRIFAPSEPDMAGAKTTAGEWTASEASTRSMAIVGDCVKEYLSKADGRKFLAFGADVAHCQEIRRQFMAAGVNTALYTHYTAIEECAEILTEFRKPDSSIRGLVSVSKISKGFDVEDVSCVIMARPLRSSLAEHIQILGRGLRWDPADPSKECIVLDHAGNCARFWDDMQEFFAEGPTDLDDGKKKKKKAKEKPKEKSSKKCPECSHMHSPAPFCPHCGFQYPPKIISHESGELVEVGRSQSSPMHVKKDTYAQLLWFARKNGYRDGWAAHKYRRRFGVWPSNKIERDETKPISRDLLKWVRAQQIQRSKEVG